MGTAFSTELTDLVDVLVLLDQEIKKIKEEKLDTLEEKRGLLLKKMERLMEESGDREVESTLGKVMFVTQNRKKLDEKAIFAKYNVSEDEITANTTINPVSFLKVTQKK